MILNSWYSHPCTMPSLGMWAGPSHSLLTSRYGKSDGLSLRRLDYKKKGLWLLEHSLILLFFLITLGETTCHVVSLSYGETHMARKWSFWPTASKDLSPGNSQWTWKQTLPPPSLEKRPQALLRFWLQPYKRPWVRTTQLSCAWIRNPQKLWDHKYVFLEAAKFWGNSLCSNR